MEIVLEVPDKDVARVLELVKGIKRVKVKSPKPSRPAANEQLLAELAESVGWVNKITRGEAPIPTQDLDGMLDELKAEILAEEAAEISANQA
ncbi:hypothetical protein A0257_00185 [Hymenobacter psoromatis]|nr:hypothetical protein A0257_00185 [Hymenobacter psoromatis]